MTSKELSPKERKSGQTQQGKKVETVTDRTAISILANKLNISQELLVKTLKATAFKECKTDEEFAAALIVANTYGLNPILKEVYAFPTKGGGVCPIVPIDGWISLVNRRTEHDGVTLVENKDDNGEVESITATFYKKTCERPTVVTEYMKECRDNTKGPWQRWPIRMLRHKAYIQGARVAYGFSGIYDLDEGQRITGKTYVGGEPQNVGLLTDMKAGDPKTHQGHSDDRQKRLNILADYKKALTTDVFMGLVGDSGFTSIDEMTDAQLDDLIKVCKEKIKLAK